MSRPGAWDEEEARAASEVARRAIWRLDVLEWVILLMAVGLAVGGGALLALLVVGGTGPGFRTAWAVASAVLILVPGGIVFARQRKEQAHDAGASGHGKGTDG